MKQGSKEGFDARKGRVTGSVVGAILGVRYKVAKFFADLLNRFDKDHI